MLHTHTSRIPTNLTCTFYATSCPCYTKILPPIPAHVFFSLFKAVVVGCVIFGATVFLRVVLRTTPQATP